MCDADPITLPPYGPRIPVYMQQKGKPGVFGPKGQIMFEERLGAGKDAAAFLGRYIGVKEKVVFKLSISRVGHLKTGGSKATHTPREKRLLTDITREYKIMSKLACGRDQGPVICAIGIAAVVINQIVYIVTVLERMDTTSDKYLQTVRHTNGADAAAVQAVVVATKALRAIRKLHDAGFMHMDAHAENWLVKYDSLAPGEDVDVRLADLGRSCSIHPDSVDSCVKLSRTRDGRHIQYDQYELIEYVQFMGFLLEMMSYTASSIPPKLADKLKQMAKDHTPLIQTFHSGQLPQAPANLKFEDLITSSGIELALNQVVTHLNSKFAK